MNTKNSSNQKNQQRETRYTQGPKKQDQKRNMLHHDLKYHEQERIETRMTD